MPIGKSAKKSLRQSRTHHLRNVSFRQKLRQAIRVFGAKPSLKTFEPVQSLLDKAVKENIFHPHKTARLKSRFAKKLSPSAAKEPVASKPSPKTKTVKKTAASKKAKKMS